MPQNHRHTIVLDVMGADGGPEHIVEGGIAAARMLQDRAQLILVGRKDDIEPILARVKDLPDNIRLEHAPNEVPMDIAATEGVRIKDSSIAVGVRLVKSGKADAFVSPGNTGAVMATSLLTLGRIEGVIRPALAGAFPTSKGRPCVVVDVGANADCKPQHLSQFAVLGSVYSQVAFHFESPRVGLLSIGEERSKGNELIHKAREALSGSKINFVGNVEGRDILSGNIEVAVTDGFTGNILLKFAESIEPLLVKAVTHQVNTNIFSRFGAMLLLPFLRRLRRTLDYAETGGAPLLGLNGIVFVCHGSSSARAITNAVALAYEMAANEIIKRTHEELITNHFGKNNGVDSESQNLRNGVLYPAGGDD